MHEEMLSIFNHKEMQIKMTLQSFSPQSEWLSSRKRKYWQGWGGGKEHLYTVSGNVN
jgi:hypothetical protein